MRPLTRGSRRRAELARRAGAETNLLLAIAVAVAGVTGVVAFTIGSAGAIATPVFLLHGTSGFAIVLLARPKRRVARRGLARDGRSSTIGLALAAATVTCVAAGIAHTTGITSLGFGAVSALQVHVATAGAAVLLVAAHWRQRPIKLQPASPSRRLVLQGAVAYGGGAALYLGLASVASVTALGGARRFTGSHERGSHDPEAFPSTQWLLDDVPHVDPNEWRLSLGERELTLGELRALSAHDVVATLDCTGGWWSEQTWTGVPVRDLLPSDARSVVVRSVTGYERRFPGHDAGELLLATACGGRPLTAEHGAPVRLVAPGRRGFWWVKWVIAVHASDDPWWWQPPLPLQ